MAGTEKLFTKTHEWIDAAGDRRRVGISSYAQDQLGDIVFVEFPAPGKPLAAGDEVCVIESCKATATVYAPLPGKLAAVNDSLADAPEKINHSPMDEGWLFELEVDPAGGDGELLTAEQYQQHLNEQ